MMGYPSAYVPFGTHWYPYFMRRLAERPANIWFFVTTFSASDFHDPAADLRKTAAFHLPDKFPHAKARPVTGAGWQGSRPVPGGTMDLTCRRTITALARGGAHTRAGVSNGAAGQPASGGPTDPGCIQAPAGGGGLADAGHPCLLPRRQRGRAVRSDRGPDLDSSTCGHPSPAQEAPAARREYQPNISDVGRESLEPVPSPAVGERARVPTCLLAALAPRGPGQRHAPGLVPPGIVPPEEERLVG